ncbi:MAG: arginine deiminase family protein [Thermoplasmata archaeon]|nr:arginine deiminase family protein [Thermoplasmata archaeon]
MRAKSEWSRLNEIMIHRPSVEIEYAMLAPKPFLFERVFNVQKAIKEHEKLENILVENGVKVRRLENEIIEKADKFESFRKIIIDFLLAKVHFYGKIDDSEDAEENFRKNIEFLDNKTIFDLMVLEPSIILRSDGSIEYPSVYSNLPLANLYFMRDQQAVADNGIIIGNMKMEQRKREIDITKLVIEHVFGLKDAFEINKRGHFEGGDFMPAGSFSLIGIGSRTDWEGAYQAIFSGKIESEEVLVVENPVYEFAKGNKMVNMHLDTYFNIAGDGLAVTSIYLAKNAKAVLFKKESKGDYVKEGHTTLYDYLKSKDFNFIDLSIPEQLAYSSNFLTIKDRRIITVNVKRVIDKLINENAFDKQTEEIVKSEMSKLGNEIFPERSDVKKEGIEFINADLIELTGGYGGAHCMTATLDRA